MVETCRLRLLLTLLVALLLRDIYATEPAYPSSRYITDIRFDLGTMKNQAPGDAKRADYSDNWAITWSADDHQYTVWGDGGGFGGNNRTGRVSLGVARIEGGRDDYRAFNLNGGVDPESGIASWPDQGSKGGKSYGIISIDLSRHGGRRGTLYLFRSGWKSGIDQFRQTELWRSTDHGLNWAFTGVRWTFDGSSGFYCPSFCQFGQDHDGGGDYVYIYAPEVTRSVTSDPWNVQKPGRLSLLRCRIDELEDTSKYQCFAGLNWDLNPAWSYDLKERKPVFSDDGNGIMRTSVMHNRGIGRYILITQQVSRRHGENGHIGIYESLHPWGGWKTVLFENPWEIGLHRPDDQKKTVYWNLSTKWLSSDGERFVMVFTGPGSDQWGTVEGFFVIGNQ